MKIYLIYETFYNEESLDEMSDIIYAYLSKNKAEDKCRELNSLIKETEPIDYTIREIETIE